jgi:hypothetical protein
MSASRGSGRKPQPTGSLPSSDRPSLPIRDLPAPAAHLPRAATVPPRKEIHPRRNIPRVPQGADHPDPDPSPAATPEEGAAPPRPGAPGALALTSDLAVTRNVALGSSANNDSAADVDEPSVASNDDVVFYTGNWYAAVSTDSGQTFQFVDPFSTFPDPPGMGFCCDQVAHFVPSLDTFFWLLQYTGNAAGENIQRIALARTDDVRHGRWRFFDITPQWLGLPPGSFLDFPDLAIGANSLYMTTNVFQGQNWIRTVLVRFPFSGFQSGNITAQVVTSQDNFNFRVAQHCGTTGFWASHQTTSLLRVFSWDEGASQVFFNDIPVARWDGEDFQSRTPLPDRFDWLGRADPRIVGAAMAGNELWFAWGSGRGGVNNRPQPFVQMARINADDFSVIDNVTLWNETFAFCYPALDSNAAGEVGLSTMIGGGDRFPSHVVGMMTGTPKQVVTAVGVHGPSGNRWGDYLTTRRHSPNPALFSATGYTLDRGTGGQDGNPRYILFGREGS